VQKRMAGAMVALELERAMEVCRPDES